MTLYPGTLIEQEYAHGQDCIFWERGRCTTGYGATWYRGTSMHAHRRAWLEAGREIPDGFLVHHICKNKLCVNVEHLRLMAWGDHSRLHHPRKEVCDRCGGSDWKIQKDGRCCRTCANARHKATHHEKQRTDPEYRERARARAAAWRKANR